MSVCLNLWPHWLKNIHKHQQTLRLILFIPFVCVLARSSSATIFVTSHRLIGETPQPSLPRVINLLTLIRYLLISIWHVRGGRETFACGHAWLQSANAGLNRSEAPSVESDTWGNSRSRMCWCQNACWVIYLHIRECQRPGAQALFYSFSDEVTPYVSNEHRLDFNDHRGGNLELKGH